MQLARFELRLEVVRTDSCRKFHADYVTARLITTYAGEGTDWLADADAARVAAGAATLGPGAAGIAGWEVGATRRAQAWYRDPVGLCAAGFNLSNALELIREKSGFDRESFRFLHHTSSPMAHRA